MEVDDANELVLLLWLRLVGVDQSGSAISSPGVFNSPAIVTVRRAADFENDLPWYGLRGSSNPSPGQLK